MVKSRLALRTAVLFRCENGDGIDDARCGSIIRVNGKSPQDFDVDRYARHLLR